MDPTELAKQVVEVVAPALPALQAAWDGAVKGITAKAGDAGRDVAKALLDKLLPRIKDKPAAREAVEDVAKEPTSDDAKASLRQQLRKLFDSDAQLAQEVSALLGQPSVTASGNGSVAVGRDVSGSVIVTGNGNTVGR